MRTVMMVHVGATLFMVGLIWFVQVVHYPLFGQVGAETFPHYAALHVHWTAWVVGLPMVTEMLTALLLLKRPPAGGTRSLLWAGFALLVVIWLSTWLLQVPQHARLVEGFDPEAFQRLVRTNWIRTAAWSLRGGLVLQYGRRLPRAAA